jgi:thiamine biosynthesis protein ThiS
MSTFIKYLFNKFNYEKKKVISFSINGEIYKISSFKKLTLQHLLVFLKYKLELVVIEYNGKIIKKNSYKTTYLLNNSNIEILTIVGGG